jgi:outer membrane protein assembly factor BamB
MSRLALAFSLTLTLALALPAADWPQFLGPHRDGRSAETGLNWNWPKEGPPVAWKIGVGSGWAGPVVAGDRLIVFHRVGDEEVVACLDPATGKEKWASKYRTRYRDDFMFDDGPRATPLVADGRLFTLGANGDLHGWELTAGKKLWHHNLLTEYGSPKGYFGVACSPVLAGGKLLINVGAKGAGIVAFDPATGREAWKATDDAASYSSPTVAEVGGKSLVLFLTRAGLVALEPEGGKVRFTFPWRPPIDASVNAATPLVWKDEIFLTVSYSTGAVLLRAKGDELEEVWKNDRSLSCHYNTPVRVGEYLYGVHGRQEGGGAQLRCVEWKTGAVKWTVPRFGVASLLAVDGGLLAMNESGELIRFDASPDGFKERGRAKVLDSPVRAAPALADGRLFARDGSKLVCEKLK